MAAEPIVTCPNCRTEIKLTESLAAPLIEATRQQYEKKLIQQNADVAKREQEIKAREERLAKEKEGVEAAVAEKIKSERARIAAEESKKAMIEIGDDLEQKAKEIAELTAVLKAREGKLAEAQKAQAELIRKQRELDDAKREMDLTIETRVQESLAKVRELAKKDAEQELSLKVIEKDLTINSMKVQIEELRRKAEQGSQELQGEALEWQLESLLSSKFLHDRIDPVPRGEHGGDILQRVVMPTGIMCGTILWESKRTKNWSDGWLPKLRDDQRQAKAEIAIIVSAVLPVGIETFDQIDSVWVVHPRAVCHRRGWQRGGGEEYDLAHPAGAARAMAQSSKGRSDHDRRIPPAAATPPVAIADAAKGLSGEL